MAFRAAQWCVSLAVLVALSVPTTAVAADNEVLILGPTVAGGTSSLEAQAVTALGLSPVVVDDATWRGMSTRQFAEYRALVIGDTGGNSTATFAAATDTTAVWGPAVSANQLVIGSDPVGHAGSGGRQLVESGIAFAADVAGETGLYVTFGDAYDAAAPGTPVPLLDGIAPSGFTVQSAACHNDAHIVAQHPAVDGLTDTNLSNWSCSVHDQFDSWPPRFQVLAIARNSGSLFTAPDGSVGVPYILAAGEGVKGFPLSATPTYASVEVGRQHTITAELLDAQTRNPVQGALLRAATELRSGQIVTRSLLGCSTSLCLSDANGEVSFTYTSQVARTDTVVVFRDANANDAPDVGEEQVRVQVDWTPPTVKPVLMIHGIDWDLRGGWSNNCAATWDDLKSFLRTHGFADRPLLTLSYYEDDIHCDRSINNSADATLGNSYFDGTGAHAGPDGGHTPEAAIEHLGYHVAWWIYDNYSRHGVPVDVVGHSMGGLIIRYALGMVDKGTSGFPPKLLIDDALTLGSPHGGARPGQLARACGKRQCSQMIPGSGFLTGLERDAWNPQGDGGTDWTAMGSDGDNAVAADRAAGTSLDRKRTLYFGSCHKVWYPDFRWEQVPRRVGPITITVPIRRTQNIEHDGYMHPGSISGGSSASNLRTYDEGSNCGAPLAERHNQLHPMGQVAKALNSPDD